MPAQQGRVWKAQGCFFVCASWPDTMPYRNPRHTHVQTIGTSQLNKCAVCYIHSDYLHSKPQEPNVRTSSNASSYSLALSQAVSGCEGNGCCPEVLWIGSIGATGCSIRACSAQQLKSYTGIFLLPIISFWRDGDHVTDLEVFLKHSHLSLEGCEPPLFPLKWELYFSCGS